MRRLKVGVVVLCLVVASVAWGQTPQEPDPLLRSLQDLWRSMEREQAERRDAMDRLRREGQEREREYRERERQIPPIVAPGGGFTWTDRDGRTRSCITSYINGQPFTNCF